MNKSILKVAFRKNALVILEEWKVNEGSKKINETTSVLIANCTKLGFTFSEALLEKVNGITPKAKLEIFELLKELTGVNKNWTPLVKQWNIPTGESIVDHFVTWIANTIQPLKGTKLPCGHLIPDNTFPLERYNGCPFCGTPFEFGELDYEAGRNKLKVLELWTEDDLQSYLLDLLQSPVALDATQLDDLKILLNAYSVPANVEISMRETLMVVIDTLVENEKVEAAGQLF